MSFSYINIIKSIYDYSLKNKTKASILSSGAGGSIVSWLLCVPGASSLLLDFVIPYCKQSMDPFLEKSSSKYCSEGVARNMARASYLKALNYTSLEGQDYVKNCIGIGCTASIVSSLVKQGEHKCYTCSYSDTGYSMYALTLGKGKRNRKEEDVAVSRLILFCLVKALGLTQYEEEILSFLQSEYDHFIQEHYIIKSTQYERLKLQEINSIMFQLSPNSSSTLLSVCDMNIQHSLIFPGSFNPVHYGHIKLAAAALKKLQSTSTTKILSVCFELSIKNADKPFLKEEDLFKRIQLFRNEVFESSTLPYRLVVTNAQMFTEKAKLFRNCIFVIGADTLIRLVDPIYYSNDRDRMILSLGEINSCGCSFIVAGRYFNNRFHSSKEVIEKVPLVFQSLFCVLEESDYRQDISSTKIRQSHQTLLEATSPPFIQS